VISGRRPAPGTGESAWVVATPADTYSTKGMKGQKARSGKDLRPGFEGGQLPMVRRAARKRGFTNIFKVIYEPINLSQLQRFEAGMEITTETLRAAGLVKRARPIKVLGWGEIDRALTLKVDAVSASARSKIEAAGGRVEEVRRGAGDTTADE
jgi:large subunit ribosomal protein L15